MARKKKKVIVEDLPEGMEIECKFRPHEKYQSIFGIRGEKVKLGSYHGTYFWGEPGFGVEKWAIIATIDPTDAKRIKELTEQDVAEGCVNFLNKPVGKRKKKQLYGNLKLHKFSLREDGSIQAVMFTDQRNNKNFWGKGQKVNRFRRKK